MTPAQAHHREAGADTIVQLRIRRANLPALENGLQLGVDHTTGQPIELQLVPRDDGTHDLLVITNAYAMASAPDAVSPLPQEDPEQ